MPEYALIISNADEKILTALTDDKTAFLQDILNRSLQSIKRSTVSATTRFNGHSLTEAEVDAVIDALEFEAYVPPETDQAEPFELKHKVKSKDKTKLKNILDV